MTFDGDVPDAGEAPREKHLERDTVALLTPIQNGRVLAAVCALNKVSGVVLETSAGAFAVIDDTSDGATDHAAQAVSAFVKELPIHAMERRDGQITIHEWLGGNKGRKRPPGLALDNAPGVITTLISGTQTIEELAETHPDKVYSARIGRFKAFRELRALAKQAKAEQDSSKN